MKLVKLEMQDYLYQFYQRIATQVGKQTEQVIVDALFKLAGELSLSAIEKQNKQP